MVPSWRTDAAVKRGAEKNLLLTTWGGLGDQICAEPTLRFALKTFKGCRVSLASEHPALFAHLPFAEVFDLKKVRPVAENYLVFETIKPQTDLVWEFMSHMLVNCVDYPALCAFRCQLPIADREVTIPTAAPTGLAAAALTSDAVFIHAGRHWQSKTFPAAWWNAVLSGLVSAGLRPVLIGGDTDDNRGTVDVDASGCVDLRNKLSIMESLAALQRASVLLTNDSAPMHMAATGKAFIGFVATCKHPDYISHWRNGKWSWRMENLGVDGIWNHVDYCPNKTQELSAENMGDLLERCLPDPSVMVDWARRSHAAFWAADTLARCRTARERRDGAPAPS